MKKPNPYVAYFLLVLILTVGNACGGSSSRTPAPTSKDQVQEEAPSKSPKKQVPERIPPSGGSETTKEKLLNAINENNFDKFLSLLASSDSNTIESIAGSLSKKQIETLLTSDSVRAVLDDTNHSEQVKDLLVQVAGVSDELKEAVFISIAKVANGKKDTLGRFVLEVLIGTRTISNATMNRAINSAVETDTKTLLQGGLRGIHKPRYYPLPASLKEAAKRVREDLVDDILEEIMKYLAQGHFRSKSLHSGTMTDALPTKTIKNSLEDEKFQEAADYVQTRIDHLGKMRRTSARHRSKLKTYREIHHRLKRIIKLKEELSRL